MLGSRIPAVKSKTPNTDIQRRFGAVLRVCRRRQGLSQEALAGKSGLHRTYIADVERGARNLSIGSIVCLSEALAVPIAELFASAASLPADSLPRRVTKKLQGGPSSFAKR